jgi:hypothetical protein
LTLQKDRRINKRSIQLISEWALYTIHGVSLSYLRSG